jgi:hypothetical protein
MSAPEVYNMSFDKDKNEVRIANHSKYSLFIYIVPKPPKRKVRAYDLLPPNSYLIYTRVQQFEITDYYFRFEKSK